MGYETVKCIRHKYKEREEIVCEGDSAKIEYKRITKGIHLCDYREEIKTITGKITKIEELYVPDTKHHYTVITVSDREITATIKLCHVTSMTKIY